jgi:hypothetical protein
MNQNEHCDSRNEEGRQANYSRPTYKWHRDEGERRDQDEAGAEDSFHVVDLGAEHEDIDHGRHEMNPAPAMESFSLAIRTRQAIPMSFGLGSV